MEYLDRETLLKIYGKYPGDKGAKRTTSSRFEIENENPTVNIAPFIFSNPVSWAGRQIYNQDTISSEHLIMSSKPQKLREVKLKETEVMIPKIKIGPWYNSIEVPFISEIGSDDFNGSDTARRVLETTEAIERDIEKLSSYRQTHPHWIEVKDSMAKLKRPNLPQQISRKMTKEDESITKQVKTIIEREESKLNDSRLNKNLEEKNKPKSFKSKERTKSQSNFEFLKTLKLEDYPVFHNVDNSVLENFRATIEGTKSVSNSKPLWQITPEVIAKLKLKSAIIRSQSQLNQNVQWNEKLDEQTMKHMEKTMKHVYERGCRGF